MCHLERGINAIIAVGYARRGFADPYEFRGNCPMEPISI